MVRKNSREWELRSLLEQNANGGLNLTERKKLINLIHDKPLKSGKDCIICKEAERNGWKEVKKATYHSDICSTHMGWAASIKQNPYDDSFKENYRQFFSK